MPSQYDTIQAPYDELRKGSISLIERANIQSTVKPFIKNARVLDLACGTGFYSYEFLTWGASKVTGVDLSATMIEEARALAKYKAPFPNNQKATIDFDVADCSKPVAYEGGPFDLVFGAWLLNYAPSGKEMVEMFRSVALNLKEGGHFVAVTPPPTQDPVAFVEAERKLRPLPVGSGGLFGTVTGEVEAGIAFHAYGAFESGDLNFDCYHLRKDVYEGAAWEGGLKGQVQWSVTDVPGEFLKDREGGAGIEELESYKVTPHYGILVVAK